MDSAYQLTSSSDEDACIRSSRYPFRLFFGAMYLGLGSLIILGLKITS